MNRLLIVTILLIIGLDCSAQVNIQSENNKYDYRNSITQDVLIFKACANYVDTIKIYNNNNELVNSFIYVPGKKQAIRYLRAGKYYLISNYFNDSVIIKADKLFIRNELINCEP